MKARIIPTLPETVLSYNISGERLTLLENAVSDSGMKHAIIPADKAGETIGFLAGYTGFSSNGTNISADEECVIFSGISSKRLDVLLKNMRSAGLDIPLKAVVTAYNQNMSLDRLLSELKKENEAIEKTKK